jgi:hypothetical protein
MYSDAPPERAAAGRSRWSSPKAKGAPSTTLAESAIWPPAYIQIAPKLASRNAIAAAPRRNADSRRSSANAASRVAAQIHA